jgi:hypothetical protein
LINIQEESTCRYRIKVEMPILCAVSGFETTNDPISRLYFGPLHPELFQDDPEQDVEVVDGNEATAAARSLSVEKLVVETTSESTGRIDDLTIDTLLAEAERRSHDNEEISIVVEELIEHLSGALNDARQALDDGDETETKPNEIEFIAEVIGVNGQLLV